MLLGRWRAPCLRGLHLGSLGCRARRLVGVGGIAYAGSHGAELLEPGLGPALIPAFKSWEKRVGGSPPSTTRASWRLVRVRMEDKGPIMAFHWRGAPDEDAARTQLEGLAQEAETAGFSTHWGRKVLEVRPPVPIDKGQAARPGGGRQRARRALRRRRRDRPRRLRALDALEDEARIDTAVGVGVSSDEGPRGDRRPGGPGRGRRARVRRVLTALPTAPRPREVPRLPARGRAPVRRGSHRAGRGLGRGASSEDTNTLVYVAASGGVSPHWRVSVLGRRLRATPGIAGLLGEARSTNALPEPGAGRRDVQPALAARGAHARLGGDRPFFPQVPVIATGYRLLVALLWRKQSAAVQAIEGRDGVEFGFDRSSPLGCRLLRLPGLRKIEPR